ncbi:unnamed protein product, partial [Lymnaea stagnalis]
LNKTFVIELSFTSFYLYYDFNVKPGYVEIYDGRNSSAKLLASYDGITYRYARPAKVRSSGNEMYIVRYAAGNGYSTNGFTASYVSFECKDFYYGKDCATPCNCTINTDSCNKLDGTCQCKKGWKSPDCSEDVNECLEDSLACPDYSTCRNLVGGYRCSCKPGLKEEQGHCVLGSATNKCLSNHPHVYMCARLGQKDTYYCPIGKELIQDSCNACPNAMYGPDCSMSCKCDFNNTMSCDGRTGACKCKQGWTSDNCSQDIDECHYDLYNCPQYSTCVNTIGSYNCTCSSEYGLVQNGARDCSRISCNFYMNDSSGVITSPNYPNTYFKSTLCTWTIEVETGNVISLSFSDFNLGYQEHTSYHYNEDSLEFHDGNGTQSGLIDKYYGGSTIPRLIRSKGNQMFIVFQTQSYHNYYDSYKGFNASYMSHECENLMFGDNCTNFCHCTPEHTQSCDNLFGRCLCHTGWKGDLCKDDVDECMGTNTKLCPYNAGCVNMQGSYTCKCVDGFKYNATTNDCEVMTRCYTCSHTCFVLDGNAKCSCPESLELDELGTTCVVPYYSYGVEAKDEKLNNGNDQAVNFTSLLPYSQKLLRGVIVTFHGSINLDIKYRHKLKIPLNEHDLNQTQSEFIAPLWTNMDLSSGEVTYHLYEKCDPIRSKEDQYNRSPLKPEVMKRAAKDVAMFQFDNTFEFEVNLVLVVTWINVQPEWDNSESPQRSTFQAIIVSGWQKTVKSGHEIISDEETSYVIFIYQKGKMNTQYLRGTNKIVVGTSSDLKRTTFLGVSRSSGIKLDVEKFNTGIEGVRFYHLGESNNGLTKCHKYLCKQSGLLNDDTFQYEINNLYKCPCSLEKLGHQWQLFSSHGKNIHCYAISTLGKARLMPPKYYRNKLCCYNWVKPHISDNWEAWVQSQRDSVYIQDTSDKGHFLINDPWTWSSFNNNEALENIKAHQLCCVNINDPLCERFYQIFPSDNCTDFATFLPASAFGDPHIITLDGLKYAMNGWGEYILMNVETRNFTLQGRTGRAETKNSSVTNATVFIAFAGKESGKSHFQVELSWDNLTMILFANKMDITSDFYENPNFFFTTDSLSVSRETRNNRTIVSASFLCGVTIRVYVALKSLEIDFEVDKSLQNKTTGLLGNFNGISRDDLMEPNGYILNSTATESAIFKDFITKWSVDKTSSVFLYNRGESYRDFNHPEFVPMFKDEADPAIVQEAEQLCGKENDACIFDYLATLEKSIAENTKQIMLKQDLVAMSLANRAPRLSFNSSSLTATGQWVVTARVETSIQVLTQDDDGDEVNIEIVEQTEGVTVTKQNTIIYTPDLLNPIALGIRAKDSKNGTSAIVYANLAVCPECSGHGECENSAVSIYFNGIFQIFQCNCLPAYTGTHCESEFDACSSQPCLIGQNCTDLTAAQQGTSLIGYSCGPCPKGYYELNGTCEDINECKEIHSLCNHNCTNTEGSFICTCLPGYRLGEDKMTCIDINECEERVSLCEQLCINDEGGYSCACSSGYILHSDHRTCDPENSIKCDGCQQICVLDNSSVSTCKCHIGYIVDPNDNKRCIDVNECDFGTKPCSQGCINTVGKFECFCHPGYRIDPDGVSCVGCEYPYYGTNCSQTCQCSGRGDCDAVKGCVCDQGWTGVSCDVDVDECDQPEACHEIQLCENMYGSYTCSCPAGWQTNTEDECVDINECTDLNANMTCDLRVETCHNTQGSYKCNCKEGYSRNAENICEDIDECELGIAGCQQICHNFRGRYNCECDSGYVLDNDRKKCLRIRDICAKANLTCQVCRVDENNTAHCSCPLGYITHDNHNYGTCEDINECNSSDNHCQHKDLCANTPGSYNCSCPPGFSLEKNRRTCLPCSGETWGTECAYDCACMIGTEKCDPVKGCICKSGYTGRFCESDLDECATGEVSCKELETCVNIPGTAVCKCKDGYLNETGTCTDVDECRSTELNNCQQACINTEGSFICYCHDGFYYDHDKNKCLDIDECQLGIYSCQQTCNNTEGGFRCTCNSGLYLDTDGQSCRATKACISKINCQHECANVNDTDVCICPKGQKLSSDSLNCEDVDLCKANVCQEGCIEIMDNTSIACTCNLGKRLSTDKTSCIVCEADKYGENCGKSCSCEKANTKFCDKVNGTCICKRGWKGNLCQTDIDECIDDSSSCPEHSHCDNTNGSFKCSCNDGYVPDNNTIWKCRECSEGFFGSSCLSHCQCGPHMTCDNVNGSCKCLPAWSGDGCETDVDECASETHNCDPSKHQVCRNTNGGFDCNCDIGHMKPCPSCDCKVCDNGNYGVNCSERCNCKMENSVLCNKTDGSCVCKQGWIGSDCSSKPKVTAETVVIPITVVFDYDASSLDLSQHLTENYIYIKGDIENQLFEKLSELLPAVVLFNVTDMRKGSLIVDADVTLNTDGLTNPQSALLNVLLKIMHNNVCLDLKNSTTCMNELNLNQQLFNKDDKPCDTKRKIDPCLETELCRNEGQEAVC